MKFIFIPASLLVLSACAAEEDIPTPEVEECPIMFRNYESTMTRTVPDATPLEQTCDNFHVVARKWMPGDTEGQTVMPGYRVIHNGVGWIYQGASVGQYLKYWDLSAEHYLFSAVTPAPNNDPGAGEGFRDTYVNITNAGEISITNVFGDLSVGDYTNSSNSPEWMVAQTERWKTPLVDLDKIDSTKPLHEDTSPLLTMTEEVPLCFHHIMAKTDILLCATSPIILQSFKCEVNDDQPIVKRADWTSTDGWTNLTSPEADKPLNFCEYVYVDGKTISADEDNPTLLCSHVQIPQSWLDAGRQLKLTFTTTDGTVYVGTITLNTTTNKTNSWVEGRHYRYIIKLFTGSGEGDVQFILFAVDMDTWKWKEGSSHEEEQSDW